MPTRVCIVEQMDYKYINIYYIRNIFTIIDVSENLIEFRQEEQ